MKYSGVTDLGLLAVVTVLSFVLMAALFGLFMGLAWRVAQWII